MTLPSTVVLFLFLCLISAKAQDTNTTVNPNAAAVSASAPTQSPSKLGAKPKCFDNLDVLADFIRDQNVFVVEKYILCPNTIFTVGLSAGTLDEFVGGSQSFPMRSNTIISCGEDGASSNNCVVTGGQINLFASSSALISTENEIRNVLIQGVTFESARSTGLLLASPGDVTFEDCIIRKQNNLGAIRMVFSRNPNARRRLAGTQITEDNYAVRTGDRRTQESVRQTITFRNCTFTENSFAETDQALDVGIVLMTEGENDAIFENCIFENNSFETVDPKIANTAIYAGLGNTLVLKNNCFLNNNFAGFGTVHVESKDAIKESSGNFGTQDTNLICQFIYADDMDGNCLNYDGDKCGSASVSLPILNETDSPSKTSDQCTHFRLATVLISLLASFLICC